MFEGFVDSVANWGAFGWAWMRTDIGSPPRVEARLGDHVIGAAIANQLREDLREIGCGAGYCGFTMKFDHPLSPGDVPDFFAVGGAETLRLNSADVVALEAAADTRGPEAAPVAQIREGSTLSLDIEGSIDMVTNMLARVRMGLASFGA